MDQLHDRIIRLVESGPAKTEVGIFTEGAPYATRLLKAKKWNPYCFRHSAITDDSDHLSEYALTKKVRWVMGSNQASRYIKNRMGDELKNRAPWDKDSKQTNTISFEACGRCSYVNKLESKYCERVGCNYPLTQLALEEIKKQEESRMNSVIDERLRGKDQEITQLKEQIEEIRYLYQDLIQRSTFVRNLTDGG